MFKSVDNIFKKIFARNDKGATYDVAQFVYDHSGEDLNAVAEKYVQGSGSKANMTRFVKEIENVTGDFLAKENIEGLVIQSRQQMLEIAENKNIPIKNYVKYRTDFDPRPQHQWFHLALDLEGLDNLAHTKESLRWINCLIECCSGEALLDEGNQGVHDSKNITQTILEKDIRKLSLEEMQQKEQEEELIYNLWQHGYLKCDLSK